MTAENSQNKENNNIVEILALIGAGKIKRKDLDENNLAVISFYGPGGLMDDDPSFAEKVRKRQSEIFDSGRKIPLYSADDLEKAKKHRVRRKKRTDPALQPRLFEDPPIKDHTSLSIFDPEQKIMQFGADLESRFPRRGNTFITEEIKHKKMELREIIGLPVARGKSVHVNDDFYKFLVKKIVKWDTFNIFTEYDCAMGGVPDGLKLKIDEVKRLIKMVLDPKLNRREKYRAFYDFIEAHKEEWGIIEYRRG